MSKLIGLLESIGQDAGLRYGKGPRQSAAQDSLARLGAMSAMCCFLAPGKEKEDEEDAPSRDDDEIKGQLTLVRAA